jgi:hypothetical protein
MCTAARSKISRVYAPRANYHGVAEEAVPFREIAEVIGRRLNVPVVSKLSEGASNHFNLFAHFAALDNPISSERTRDLFGWRPEHLGLIRDLDGPRYFPNGGTSTGKP